MKETKKLLLIEPNIEGLSLMPTISISFLKSFINKKTNHQAKIIDLTFHKKDWKQYLKKRVEEEKPDLVGISVLSFNYNQALEISSFIKENYNTKIIFGGVHVILSPDETIKSKNVDMICTGEGEYVLKELLDKDLNCKDIKGIWYKKGDRIIKNPPTTTIPNLDELPFPDWDDFELEKYFLLSNNHLPIMASRGCPYNCTYCSNHALRKKLIGPYVRFRSVDNVINEIEERIDKYYNQGLRYLFFYDDTLVLNKEYIFEFCRKFKEKGFDKLIEWNMNVRADLVTDEMIKVMKDSGCNGVRMGVEAANDFIRNKIYKRNMSKEQIYKAIEIIQKYKLQLRLNFIIGAPYETIEMMRESFEMAKKSNTHYFLFPMLMPLPATEIREMCEKEGLIEEKGFKNSWVMNTRPLTRTMYASRKEIKKLSNEIKRYQAKILFLKGLKMRGPIFIFDLIMFFCYYKPKYKLGVDNVFRFTINKYELEDRNKIKINL